MTTESKTASFPAATSVPADTRWFRTGIILQSGVQYRFSAQGTWYDWYVKCGPDGYEMRREIPKYLWPVFWAAQFLKPLPTGERWFQLLGKVGGSTFEIGSSKVLAAPDSGELLCTANDARGLFRNNKGELTLVVTRET